MVGTETGLELFEEIVMGEMGVEFFQDFGQEGEIGDGPEVIEVLWVSAGFLEDGGDGCRFQG